MDSVNVEALITLIERNPALYDLEAPHYTDHNHKADIWISIAQELNVDVTVCKAKWNNLRDNFRNFLKRRAEWERSKRAKRKPATYKYAHQLRFLNPQYQPDDEPGDSVVRPSNLDVNTAKDVAPSGDKDSNRQQSWVETSAKRDYKPPPPATTWIKVELNEEDPVEATASSTPWDTALSTAWATATQLHPADLFLASLAPTLRRLPPALLARAKSEIFATTHRYEMLALNEETKVLRKRMRRRSPPRSLTEATERQHCDILYSAPCNPRLSSESSSEDTR